MRTAHLSRTLSVNMFSADDLINSGAHHTSAIMVMIILGNVLTGKPTFDDFFTQKDANGNFTREIAAISAYIYGRLYTG